MFNGTDKIFAWASKELSEESMKSPVTSDNNFAQKLTFIDNGRIGAKFKLFNTR